MGVSPSARPRGESWLETDWSSGRNWARKFSEPPRERDASGGVERLRVRFRLTICGNQTFSRRQELARRQLAASMWPGLGGRPRLNAPSLQPEPWRRRETDCLSPKGRGRDRLFSPLQPLPPPTSSITTTHSHLKSSTRLNIQLPKLILLQVPDVILKDMLSAALQLRGAFDSAHNNALKPKLEDLLRRVFVAHVLAQKWVVAIGGSQGAGKTTLVRQLYDLGSTPDDWLPANEGQGERVPVLVQEFADMTKPEGWIYKLVRLEGGHGAYDVSLEKVDVSQFRRAARGDQPDYLLPVLKVPGRHFQAADTSLLLLPGYEKQKAVWQELMKQALAAAGACVIVTDATRLANNTNQEILRDTELSGITPVVVITKTEEAGDDLRAKLRERAVETFRSSGGDVDGVLCTGVGAPFTDDWSSKLVEMIANASNSASRVQGLRVKHLITLLDDVRALLTDAREDLEAGRDKEEDVWDSFIAKQLSPFDKAVDKLRRSYAKQLNAALSTHRDKAFEELLRAIKPDEGFKGWLVAKSRTTSEKLERQRALIERAWCKPGDVQECHLQALTYATFEKLGGSGGLVLDRKTFSAGTALDDRTGYKSASNNPGSAIPETVKNLSVLLSPTDHSGLSETAEKDIALLPALALEFTRLVQVAAVKRVDPHNAPPEGTTMLDALEQVKDNFSAVMSVHNHVVGTLGTVFGVQEGENLHTLISTTRAKLKGQDGKLMGAAGSLLLGADLMLGGLATAAVVGAAVVGIGLLVRGAEKEALGQAEAVLAALEESHRAAFLSRFDEIMEVVRERLVNAQRERLHLNRGVYERSLLADALRRLERAAASLEKALPPLL